MTNPAAAPGLISPFDARLPPRPYPGLRPFQREEWPIFFGREPMTDRVIDLVIEKKLVVVHGDSGCGKSSLIRAGVLVQLEQGHAATGGRWRTAAMLPREDPLGNLAKALASVDGGAGRFMRGNKYCVRLTVSAKPSKRAQLPRNSERMVRMA